MKTYIFHYPVWHKMPDGGQQYTVEKYITRAISQQAAEVSFWDFQRKKQSFSKYIKVEFYNYRLRKYEQIPNNHERRL